MDRCTVVRDMKLQEAEQKGKQTIYPPMSFARFSIRIRLEFSRASHSDSYYPLHKNTYANTQIQIDWQCIFVKRGYQL